MQSVAADKYIAAVKRNRIAPIRGKWLSQRGACPLYIYCWGILKKIDETCKIEEKDRILKFMLNRVGIDYRNGFTYAIDGLEPTEEELKNGHFRKGYEEGQYVASKMELYNV